MGTRRARGSVRLLPARGPRRRVSRFRSTQAPGCSRGRSIRDHHEAMMVGTRPVPMTRRLQVVVDAVDSPAMLVHELGGAHLVRASDETGDRNDLLVEACHQADLAFQPYVDESHVLLAAARLLGNRTEWRTMRANGAKPWPPRRRWWRPLGRRSAARRAPADIFSRTLMRGPCAEAVRGRPDVPTVETKRFSLRDEDALIRRSLATSTVAAHEPRRPAQ